MEENEQCRSQNQTRKSLISEAPLHRTPPCQNASLPSVKPTIEALSGSSMGQQISIGGDNQNHTNEHPILPCIQTITQSEFQSPSYISSFNLFSKQQGISNFPSLKPKVKPKTSNRRLSQQFERKSPHNLSESAVFQLKRSNSLDPLLPIGKTHVVCSKNSNNNIQLSKQSIFRPSHKTLEFGVQPNRLNGRSLDPLPPNNDLPRSDPKDEFRKLANTNNESFDAEYETTIKALGKLKLRNKKKPSFAARASLSFAYDGTTFPLPRTLKPISKSSSKTLTGNAKVLNNCVDKGEFICANRNNNNRLDDYYNNSFSESDDECVEILHVTNKNKNKNKANSNTRRLKSKSISGTSKSSDKSERTSLQSLKFRQIPTEDNDNLQLVKRDKSTEKTVSYTQRVSVNSKVKVSTKSRRNAVRLSHTNCLIGPGTSLDSEQYLDSIVNKTSDYYDEMVRKGFSYRELAKTSFKPQSLKKAHQMMTMKERVYPMALEWPDVPPRQLENLFQYAVSLTKEGISEIGLPSFEAEMLDMFGFQDASTVPRIFELMKNRRLKMSMSQFVRLLCIFLSTDLMIHADYTFGIYDSDGDGSISGHELYSYLFKSKNPLTEQEVLRRDDDEALSDRIDNIKELVEMTMTIFKCNKTNTIDKYMFKEGIKAKPELIQFMGQTLPNRFKLPAFREFVCTSKNSAIEMANKLEGRRLRMLRYPQHKNLEEPLLCGQYPVPMEFPYLSNEDIIKIGEEQQILRAARAACS